MSHTPAEEQPGKPPRLPGGRLTYERGIRYSSLPAPSRHLALTIATWADVDTGIIPDRFQPAKGVLEESTGLSRGAIVKHLNLLEEQGWISRETGGGAGRRTKFRLRIPAGAKTGHQVTPSVPENGSPRDLFHGNGSPREQKTGHEVNKNGSPGDPKSLLNPYESLSQADAPEPDRQQPPVPPVERETTAAPQNDNTARQIDNHIDNQAQQIANTWTAARGGRRNPAAERQVANTAAELLLAGWTIEDLTALAQDMAAKYPTGRDLTRHADHWQPPKTVPVSRVIPLLPDWCGQCADGNPAAATEPARRFITQSDGSSTRCHCHPASTVRAA